MAMSIEDYKALHEGIVTEEVVGEKEMLKEVAAATSRVSARDFLLSQTKMTKSVNIAGLEIEIYVKLSKRQIRENAAFINMLDKPIIDSPEGDLLTAKFLAEITVDDELDVDFWLNEDLDVSVPQTVLAAYIQEVTTAWEDVVNFRKK